MNSTESLKLCISYSHLDEHHINKFNKFINTLITNGLITSWYDRKITAGECFQETIDNNLEKADVICLFISVNFLSSRECMKEKKTAIELKKLKGISIVPIIISTCPWKDDEDLVKF